MVAEIVLAVVAVVLLVERFLARRQEQVERAEWMDALQDSTRKAIRIAVARDGFEYERAEAVAEHVDRVLTAKVDVEEHMPEGLG